MPNDRSSQVMGHVLTFLAGVFLGMLVVAATPHRAHAQAAQRDGTFVTPRQLAIPVAAVFGASVYAIHADKQWHHEYIGAALLLSNRRWVQWAGLAIMVDDAAQHLIQTRHPTYRSPLHQAYAVTLYRWFR